MAWLSLDSQEGQEYWSAMELMGGYAAANHALIHQHVAANLGTEVLLDLENHHIHEVMAAQRDLVTVLGQFDPKFVKMAPHGERAED